jgi:hypothetical protein
MTSPLHVLIRFSRAAMMYNGIMSIGAGIICVARSPTSPAVRPGKLQREKP